MITIDQYALIDFGGVEALVNAVGGVTITVTEPFEQNGVTFRGGRTEGRWHRGARLCELPERTGRRFRPDQAATATCPGDPRQGLRPRSISLVRELLPQLQDHVRTDLSPLDLVALGSRFLNSCTDETLVTMNLEGSVATFDDPLFGVPLSYVVVPEDEVRWKVAELTAP